MIVSNNQNISLIFYVKDGSSCDIRKENRINIRLEFKQSLSVPFSLKGSSKCTNHVNVHKLFAVEYINTVCSLDYPFKFRIF